MEWVGYVNLGALALLAVLGLWIKDKFFVPIEKKVTDMHSLLAARIVDVTGKLEKAVADESNARKLETQRLEGACINLTEAVRAVEQMGRRLTDESRQEAFEKGRQDERMKLANARMDGLQVSIDSIISGEFERRRNARRTTRGSISSEEDEER